MMRKRAGSAGGVETSSDEGEPSLPIFDQQLHLNGSNDETPRRRKRDESSTSSSSGDINQKVESSLLSQSPILDPPMNIPSRQQQMLKQQYEEAAASSTTKKLPTPDSSSPGVIKPISAVATLLPSSSLSQSATFPLNIQAPDPSKLMAFDLVGASNLHHSTDLGANNLVDSTKVSTPRLPTAPLTTEESSPITNTKRSQVLFPVQLHRLLTDAMQDPDLADIISWHPDGHSFSVRNADAFSAKVLPVYFGAKTKYRSFQRQLQLYDFVRAPSAGNDSDSSRKTNILDMMLHHKLFHRDKPELARFIRRRTIKKSGNGHKQQSSPIDPKLMAALEAEAKKASQVPQQQRKRSHSQHGPSISSGMFQHQQSIATNMNLATRSMMPSSYEIFQSLNHQQSSQSRDIKQEMIDHRLLQAQPTGPPPPPMPTVLHQHVYPALSSTLDPFNNPQQYTSESGLDMRHYVLAGANANVDPGTASDIIKLFQEDKEDEK